MAFSKNHRTLLRDVFGMVSGEKEVKGVAEIRRDSLFCFDLKLFLTATHKRPRDLIFLVALLERLCNTLSIVDDN